MPKSWFNVRAEAGHVEASIRGPIGEWGETDRAFIARIEAAGDVKTIGLTINSRGGEVDHALAIFNYLRQHPARVAVKIDGIAASAASVIAMAADEIIMPANALMMVHSPWAYASGNADELRKAADDLEKFEAALIETYMSRTGRDADAIKALLAAETWMTAEEAVAAGFADVIEPITRSAAIAMAEASGIPPDVLSRLAELEAPAEPSEPAHEGHAEALDEGTAEALAAEVSALCAAAARSDLVEHMLPLASASGVEAVRAALAGLAKPSGIQSAQPATVSEEAAKASDSALARLGLRAINPRARA